MPSRIPVKMKADQLMQSEKQSCKPQSKACPHCPQPRTGQGSLFSAPRNMETERPSLPKGDYSLKTKLIERRLLLVQNQSHLLSCYPLAVPHARLLIQ